MRGSPLKRALIVATLLVVVGFGLFHHTAASPEREQVQIAPAVERSVDERRIPARIRITLSVAPSALSLKAGSEVVELARTPQGVYEGDALLDVDEPVIFLKVKPEAAAWAGGTHVFAKLVIEPEQRDTITHVFDGTGDIDDFMEIEF